MDERNTQNGQSVDVNSFRNGMSKVMAAVHIITVRDGDEVLGTTATAVCSVSDSPPTLLVCLHRQGRVCNVIQPGMSLAVNTLAEGHDELANIFAGAGSVPMAERFTRGAWQVSATQAPMLRDSIVSFQTQVVESIEACSHDIIVCRVVDIQDAESASDLPDSVLLYGARRYHTAHLPKRA